MFQQLLRPLQRAYLQHLALSTNKPRLRLATKRQDGKKQGDPNPFLARARPYTRHQRHATDATTTLKRRSRLCEHPKLEAAAECHLELCKPDRGMAKTGRLGL